MKYYIDCEFEGRGGQLLSMALVSETGKSMYVVMNYAGVRDPWVLKNVLPLMLEVPIHDVHGPLIFGASPGELSSCLEEFLSGDEYPVFIADGEQDIMYLCDALVGPEYVPGRRCVDLKFSIKRVEPYPTTLPGAIQHNAYWDAMALRHLFDQPAEITEVTAYANPRNVAMDQGYKS